MNKTTTVTIDGKQYVVDIDKAVKDGYIKPVVTHKWGNIYKHLVTGEYYILSIYFDYGHRYVSLVCLNDGMYWSSPYQRNRTTDQIEADFRKFPLNDYEWQRVTNDKTGEFEFVCGPLDIGKILDKKN